MITIKVGNRIRKLRKQKNLSQEKLAYKSELDRTYIASVEAGKRNISIVNLEKIVSKGLE
jgi:transcriptional regulator with XRE-family HTH domain